MRFSQGFSKDGKRVAKIVASSLRLFYEFFYKFDLLIPTELNKNREDVKNIIKKLLTTKSVEEVVILRDLGQILELILELVGSRVGIEY